ncbi:MAG: hypothetical protein HYV97_02615 [Bdellovibrio sp.]|nr:hypothetical protein [Bdellovibrio sp.]
MSENNEGKNVHGFCRIPANIVETYADNIPFDIYLQLSDNKVVKLEKHGSNAKDVIAKYAVKGIQYFYADKEDYVIFVNTIRQDMEKTFGNKTLPKEKKLKNLSDGYEMVHDSLIRIGLSEDVAAIAKEVTQKSLELISEQTNVFSFFKEFKDKCHAAYMRNTLLSWIVTGMLETFDWSNSALRGKMCLAVMLRDILLTNEELKALREKPIDQLSFGIKNHPEAMAALINEAKREYIPKDVAAIIIQHHEAPDGSGFPKGLHSWQISKLSSLIIVGDVFIDAMFRYNFEPSKKEFVISDLWDRYKNDDKFIAAVKSLKTMLDKT